MAIWFDICGFKICAQPLCVKSLLDFCTLVRYTSGVIEECVC